MSLRHVLLGQATAFSKEMAPPYPQQICYGTKNYAFK